MDTGSAETPNITQDGDFDLTLTGQEAGTTVVYEVSIDGAAFVATTANQAGLGDGNYVFQAIVTDAAGNSATTSSIEVTIDNTAPARLLRVHCLSQALWIQATMIRLILRKTERLI